MEKCKDIKCVYSYRDDNMELKGGMYDCLVISKSGSISFTVREIEQQLLVNEKILRKAFKKKKSLETEGVYIIMNGNGPMPVKCKVHIKIMPLVTNMYVVDMDYSIGVHNSVLEQLLV